MSGAEPRQTVGDRETDGEMRTVDQLTLGQLLLGGTPLPG